MNENAKVVIMYALGAGVVLLLIKKMFGAVSNLGKPSAEEKNIMENDNLKSNSILKTMKTGKQVKLFPQTFVKKNANDIYKALGTFTIDNDEKVIGIFEQYRHKSQVQQLSEMFYRLHGISLRSFLAKFLSNNSLKQIETMIEKLP